MPGSCRWCRRRGRTAACTFSTGTIAITAIRTPIATRRASTATHGRLYRVVYKDYKPAGKFDLTKESDDKLIERLDSPNIFYRDTAQRVLTERLPQRTRT